MHRPLILHTNDVVKKVGPNCSGTDNFWKSGEAKWSLAAARTNWRNLELWKRHHLFQSVFSGPLQIQRYCSVCWNTETGDRPQSFVWDDFPTVEYWQCQCQGKCLQIWKRSEGRISNELQTLSAPDTWGDPTWPQPLLAVQRLPQLASLLEEQSSHASLQLCRTACLTFSLRLARESPVLLRIVWIVCHLSVWWLFSSLTWYSLLCEAKLLMFFTYLAGMPDPIHRKCAMLGTCVLFLSI